MQMRLSARKVTWFARERAAFVVPYGLLPGYFGEKRRCSRCMARRYQPYSTLNARSRNAGRIKSYPAYGVKPRLCLRFANRFHDNLSSEDVMGTNPRFIPIQQLTLTFPCPPSPSAAARKFFPDNKVIR